MDDYKKETINLIKYIIGGCFLGALCGWLFISIIAAAFFQPAYVKGETKDEREKKDSKHTKNWTIGGITVGLIVGLLAGFSAYSRYSAPK